MYKTNGGHSLEYCRVRPMEVAAWSSAGGTKGGHGLEYCRVRQWQLQMGVARLTINGDHSQEMMLHWSHTGNAWSDSVRSPGATYD